MNLLKIDFTVAICTYNGAQRVPEVLDCLLAQQGTEKITWEVLVVDNNSSDQTAEVVREYQQKWRSDVQLRYYFEPQQGTTFAREAAIQQAQSQELVGFLDDDNLPGQNWVVEAYQFGITHPQAGAYGGIVHAKLDVEPPSYFDSIKSFLAVYNYGSKPKHFPCERNRRCVIAAPGSVIRKQAWLDCVHGGQQILEGRDEKNNSLLGSGEDLEAMYLIQNSDWQIWYNPKMEIWHHIFTHRLEKAYLLKIAKQSGLSNHALRLAKLQKNQRFWFWFVTPAYAMSDGYKALSYYWKYRSQLAQDVGKACEFESRLGKFQSPWLFLSYFLRKALLKKS